MEDSQLASLTRMMTTVNAGDAGGYAALYASHAVITIHGLGVLEGRGAIERHEVELLRQFPGTRLAFSSVWQVDGRAVVRYAVNGKTSEGRPMGHEGLLFYRFDASGLIQSEQRYMDALTPMAQLGMPALERARPIPELTSTPELRIAKHSTAEEENVRRLIASLAALEAADEAVFLRTLGGNVLLDELILPRPFQGQDGAADWFRSWTGAFTGASSEIKAIYGVGEDVLAETVLRGVRREPFGPLPASRAPFTVHRAVVARMARVAGGGIERVSFFMNGREFPS